MKTLKRIRNVFTILGVLAFFSVGAIIFGAADKGARFLSDVPYSTDSDYIVLLPAGAIPSGATFTRAYAAADQYKKNPTAKIIISHITNPPIENSTIWGIRNELILRGVPETAILLETKARNTSEHAKYIKEAGFGDPENDKYLIVTSPTHIKRSAMVFSKAGFRHVYAAPAWEKSAKENLGSMTFLRYGIWGSLKLAVDVTRELIAIAYYKLTWKA